METNNQRELNSWNPNHNKLENMAEMERFNKLSVGGKILLSLRIPKSAQRKNETKWKGREGKKEIGVTSGRHPAYISSAGADACVGSERR